MQQVLIIDDNPSIGKALKLLLSLHQIDSEVALTPQAGIQRLEQNPGIALVLQDMNFSQDTTSGEEGKRLFSAIRALRPDLPIILITAWTQLETAIELVKQGAADYLGKPWDDNKLITSVKNLLELQELQAEQLQRTQLNESRRKELSEAADLCGLIYQSEAMHQLLTMAVKIARTQVPVLITGPNGSGKEKIAKIVQRNSERRDGPFICVNAGALPNDLMEAELFGAEAGAYTGSTKTRIGRFEAAHGGTLFLDELGNLSASGQAKLLRVLQSGEFERLGSSETRRCDVRLISATNTDLTQAIAEGHFREDLYYRLNVFELKLPSLAERPEDILPLVRHFLGDNVKLELSTVKALQSWPWPGSIRELENACRRAAILSDGENPTQEDFGIAFAENEATPSRVVVEPSREMIEEALRQNQGVVARAARQLGLSRQALYRRMEQYDIKTS
ncbi:sigma-54 dependent transcriptional regulator [Marinimicrobium sp. ABcell2]|uniref:sigma-54-dependent transcriptional regulator n=1 Tax=Marinimicrobium sp. ABcell2 TaxID=3069751 RepID=UPI0027B2D457|nr:sigma-54 dependent transcriptional regulator [Marinimicrobium sp. ABcell2]MDQ2077748.1 sigma-54 dependent transcriptional regulator [Marinimicrobium sp. ABcell2]